MLAITKTELWMLRYAIETGEDTDGAIEVIDSILAKNVAVQPITTYEEQCAISEEEIGLIDAGDIV